VALLGFGPALFTAVAIPFLGVPMVAVAALVIGFLVASVSLYVADQIVEGFEIKDFGTTMLCCFLIGLINCGRKRILMMQRKKRDGQERLKTA
jgi:hypothetical protein